MAHAAIPAPAWLARTRLARAAVLVERGSPADAEPARVLLEQALATARQLGLTTLEASDHGRPHRPHRHLRPGAALPTGRQPFTLTSRILGDMRHVDSSSLAIAFWSSSRSARNLRKAARPASSTPR